MLADAHSVVEEVSEARGNTIAAPDLSGSWAFALPRCYERLPELESQAEQFVKDHWNAVRAVANELLKHLKLTEAEVRTIVETTMPQVRLSKPKA